jgi:hypothetical protein
MLTASLFDGSQQPNWKKGKQKNAVASASRINIFIFNPFYGHSLSIVEIPGPKLQASDNVKNYSLLCNKNPHTNADMKKGPQA